MTDETENVDAGSETSGEQAETAQVESTNSTTETVQTDAGVQDAGGAAETTETSEVTEDASRTGYAEKGLRAGDACTCPDGRKGTVHQYDAGLICIPNQDQG
jgi:hypothetical protein